MIGVPHGLVSEAGPTQGAPQSLPLIQERVLVWVPAPQSTEHGPNALNPVHLELIIGVPQARVSADGPTHGVPWVPRMQERVLVCTPAPHCTEHALKALKAVHLEGTITMVLVWTTAVTPHDLVSITARPPQGVAPQGVAPPQTP